jgi:hypothetical protein
MPYLPKHYVKTGLVANEGQFIGKVNGTPYSGPYYEIGTGQVFSGLGPQDRSSQELTRFGNSENPPGTAFQEVSVAFNLDVLNLRPGESSNFIQNSPGVNFQIYQAQMVDDYTRLKKFTEKDYSNRMLPSGITPIPTEEDYTVGEYIRYFTKKVNENTYLELDEAQHTAITKKDSKIFYEQYFAFTLPWTLTGEEPKVFQTNKNITQRRIMNLRLVGFDRFLEGNYLKFYKK